MEENKEARPVPGLPGYRWADKGDPAKEYVCLYWDAPMLELRDTTLQDDEGCEQRGSPDVCGDGAVMPWPGDPRIPGSLHVERTKATNPKDVVGVRKVPVSTVPANVIQELGLAMLEGARKYGRHNYRVSGVSASVYYDAAMGHLMDWWEGTDTDPDSGLHHVAKAIATLTVLRDAQMRGMCTDDRPPCRENPGISRNDPRAGQIIDKYPDAKPAHTRGDDATP
jgi:hypothetical protein